MGVIELPDGVLGMARRGADWARWVDALPSLVRDLLDGRGNLPEHRVRSLVDRQ